MYKIAVYTLGGVAGCNYTETQYSLPLRPLVIQSSVRVPNQSYFHNVLDASLIHCKLRPAYWLDLPVSGSSVYVMPTTTSIPSPLNSSFDNAQIHSQRRTTPLKCSRLGFDPVLFA